MDRPMKGLSIVAVDLSTIQFEKDQTPNPEI